MIKKDGVFGREKKLNSSAFNEIKIIKSIGRYIMGVDNDKFCNNEWIDFDLDGNIQGKKRK